MRVLAIVVGGGVVMVAAVGAGFVWAMRTKFAPVQDHVRRLNRAWTNPRVLQHAGSAGAKEAAVHHVGRTSGRTHVTPVGAVPTDDGFVVGLPYGPGTDWVRNILAAGGATIEFDGVASQVIRPRVVSHAAVEHWFSPGERRLQRLFGVDDVLVVHAASSVPATTSTESTTAT